MTADNVAEVWQFFHSTVVAPNTDDLMYVDIQPPHNRSYYRVYHVVVVVVVILFLMARVQHTRGRVSCAGVPARQHLHCRLPR